MRTYNRIVIKDHVVEAQNGDRFEVKRGEQYTTSVEEDGMVVVFGRYWCPMPVKIFAGEQVFTEN